MLFEMTAAQKWRFSDLGWRSDTAGGVGSLSATEQEVLAAVGQPGAGAGAPQPRQQQP